MSADEGIDLTYAQVFALAGYLVAELVENAVQDGLLCWELVPSLKETSWGAVANVITTYGANLRDAVEDDARFLAVNLGDLMRDATR